MKQTGTTPEEIISNAPEERREALTRLRSIIRSNLPEKFQEGISYGMIGYVIPHEIYPAGYHCDPKLPLPFMSFASQKNFIAFYHMGMYSKPELLTWFQEEYKRRTQRKPDMGKSCVRFKKPEDIPFDLIGELVASMSADEWITCYETQLKTSKK